jgi:hypothetical protein
MRVCGRSERKRGRLKDSWMVIVVDKCLKNKNVRSTKCKRKCQRNIMISAWRKQVECVKIELNR